MSKLVNGSCALLLLLLSGCGGPDLKRQHPPESNWERRLAGRIEKVDLASGFVLIRRYGSWHVADGEVVESRGDKRTANLLPTGEHLGEHVAADIRSGEAREGDVVYIRKVMTAGKPENSGLTEDRGGADNQAETP